MTHTNREIEIDDSTRIWTDSRDIENGRQVWRLVQDGQVVAELHTSTQRRYSRWDSSQRISDLTTTTAKVRLAYGVEFEIPQEIKHFGGEVSSLRDFAKQYGSSQFWVSLWMDVQIVARAAGISEREIMMCESYDRTHQQNAAKLMRLVMSKQTGDK